MHFAAHQAWLFWLQSLWVRAASALYTGREGFFPNSLPSGTRQNPNALDHLQKEDLHHALLIYFLAYHHNCSAPSLVSFVTVYTLNITMKQMHSVT